MRITEKKMHNTRVALQGTLQERNIDEINDTLTIMKSFRTK